MWRRFVNFIFRGRSAVAAKKRLQMVVDRDRSKKDPLLEHLRDEILAVCGRFIDMGNVVQLDISLQEDRLLIQGEIELAEVGDDGKARDVDQVS